MTPRLTVKIGSSIKKNYRGILIMAVAAVFVALGQLMWKISAGSDWEIIIYGFLLYGVGTILMITAFRFGSLSVVHPVISLSYVLAILWGIRILEETVSNMQVLGLLAVISGVFLISIGDA